MKETCSSETSGQEIREKIFLYSLEYKISFANLYQQNRQETDSASTELRQVNGHEHIRNENTKISLQLIIRIN
jgi:hypothetical protein